MHCKPVQLDCTFIVDSANGNGLGIRSLKGSGMIKNVFMHTSATPGTNNGQTNPNPPPGYIIVQFKDNYQRYLAGNSGFGSPVSGTPLTSVTANSVYTITTLGTTTAAQWQAVGVPSNITPAVGVSFVASTSASIGGSGTVEAPLATGSGISNIDVIGDPNTTNAPSPQSAAGPGGYMIIRCLSATNSTTTTLVATAPANNSTCSLTFLYDDSSVLPGDGG